MIHQFMRAPQILAPVSHATQNLNRVAAVTNNEAVNRNLGRPSSNSYLAMRQDIL